MKTRNQLNCSRGAASSSNTTTNQAGNEIPNNSSLSPPRLRDRRSSGLETKSTDASAAAAVTAALVTSARIQSPSPSAGVKRSLTGPTRILPRRSCGRQNSLLADNQLNPSAITSKTKSSFKSESISSEQSSLDKDTQKQPSISPLQGVDCERETSMSIETSTVGYYLNGVASISSASPSTSKHIDDIEIRDISNHDKRHKQLVCISLPNSSVGTKSLNSTQTTPTNGSNIEKGPVTTSANAISHTKTFNILIGVTGSVAAIKLVELTNLIKSKFPSSYTNKLDGSNVEASVKIKIVMTTSSLHFAPKDDLINKLKDPSTEIYDDSDEWSLWKKIDDPVLHIDLRKWADLFLIAPLDANTMAKLANGICDNLLTCVVRAWEISKPLIYCPAMNVHMYNHPLTREHLCKLQSFGYFRVDCVEKRLACGDFGMGGMAPVESITDKVVDTLISPVTRKLSLTKPLLNQQPTYPLLTDNSDQGQCQSNPRFSASISNQILHKFRTGNQITIHPVPSISRANDYTNGNSVNGAESLLIRPGSLNDLVRSEKCRVVDRNRRNKHYITINDNGKSIMGGVTSVQNLKLIGLDTVKDDASVVGDELGIDFDPSKLLEQSMVTDDSLMIMDHEQTTNASLSNSTDQSLDCGSSFGQIGSAAKIDCLTPLFNTSKFLALCHNKERGCFTCTICKHDYKNRKSMARHLKEQHVQGNIYQCKPCGVAYKRREKLVKHIRERH